MLMLFLNNEGKGEAFSSRSIRVEFLTLPLQKDQQHLFYCIYPKCVKNTGAKKYRTHMLSISNRFLVTLCTLHLTSESIKGNSVFYYVLRINRFLYQNLFISF